MKKPKKLLYLGIVAVCMLTACNGNEKKARKDTKDALEIVDDSENSTTTNINVRNDMKSDEIDETKKHVEYGYDLNAELAEVEIQSDELMKKLQTDMTQMELNQTASDWYTLWDTELNSLWSRISDTVDVNTKNMILVEQRSWIVDKETAVKEAASDYKGGSIQPLIANKKAAKLTRARCYDLAVYLGEAIGQTVEPIRIEYSGRYVDTQGTMESYGDLYITEETDGTYKVEIGIYRVTTLEGTAKLDDGILKFIDNYEEIKADILVEDETATVVITESKSDLIFIGDRFEYPEKW